MLLEKSNLILTLVLIRNLDVGHFVWKLEILRKGCISFPIFPTKACGNEITVVSIEWVNRSSQRQENVPCYVPTFYWWVSIEWVNSSSQRRENCPSVILILSCSWVSMVNIRFFVTIIIINFYTCIIYHYSMFT